MDSRLGIWTIDSGASHNYCNDLTEFKKDSMITEANMIKLEDKNEVHARKKGVVQLNGVCIKAFFVPEFRISLLSVSQLDSHGLTAIFKNGIYPIIDHLATILPRHAGSPILSDNPPTIRICSHTIHYKHSEIRLDRSTASTTRTSQLRRP
jgi:hypothetical protein